jgi:hypothetical protein
MDRKIILWDTEGKQRDSWGTTAIRVTDLAVTPDLTRVVALGMYFHLAAATPVAEHSGSGSPPVGTPAAGGTVVKENKMIIYDFATKQVEA